MSVFSTVGTEVGTGRGPMFSQNLPTGGPRILNGSSDLGRADNLTNEGRPSQQPVITRVIRAALNQDSEFKKGYTEFQPVFAVVHRPGETQVNASLSVERLNKLLLDQHIELHRAFPNFVRDAQASKQPDCHLLYEDPTDFSAMGMFANEARIPLNGDARLQKLLRFTTLQGVAENIRYVGTIQSDDNYVANESNVKMMSVAVADKSPIANFFGGATSVRAGNMIGILVKRINVKNQVGVLQAVPYVSEFGTAPQMCHTMTTALSGIKQNGITLMYGRVVEAPMENEAETLVNYAYGARPSDRPLQHFASHKDGKLLYDRALTNMVQCSV